MTLPGKFSGGAPATGLAIYCTNRSIDQCARNCCFAVAVNQHLCQPMGNDTCQERAIHSVLRHWPHPDCLQIVSVSYMHLLTQMK